MLCRLARCTPAEMLDALRDLAATGAADVTPCPADVTTVVTVHNRRLFREWRKRKQTAIRVDRHRRKEKPPPDTAGGNAGVTSLYAPPSESESEQKKKESAPEPERWGEDRLCREWAKFFAIAPSASDWPAAGSAIAKINGTATIRRRAFGEFAFACFAAWREMEPSFNRGARWAPDLVMFVRNFAHVVAWLDGKRPKSDGNGGGAAPAGYSPPPAKQPSTKPWTPPPPDDTRGAA